MISHDGTTLAWELWKATDSMMLYEDLKAECGDRCDDFDKAVDNLKDAGFLTAICGLAKVSLANLSSSKINLSKEARAILSRANSSSSYIKLSRRVSTKNPLLVLDTSNTRLFPRPDPQRVLAEVRKAITGKNFSAAYQAVVTGKKARKDPIVEAGKRLHASDAANYWTAIGGMDEDERKVFRDRLTRSTPGSSRDGATS